MNKKNIGIIKSNEYGNINGKEIKLALDDKEIEFYNERILKVNMSESDINKLKSIYSIREYGKLIKVINNENFLEEFKKIKWENHIENPYYIEKIPAIPKIKYNRIKKDINILKTKDICDKIWFYLKDINFNPKVDLDNFKTKISFFVTKDYTAIIKNVKKGNQSFESRSNNNRPFRHPTTLKPKLARIVINYLSIFNEDEISIIDPFCGTGGFLLELCSLKKELNKKWNIYGNDIKEDMIDGSKKNLKHYGFSSKLFNQDTFNLDIKVDYLVSDIPYGKHSFTSDKMTEMIKRFIKWIRFHIEKKSCIVFPKKYQEEFEKECNHFDMKIEELDEIYVHGTLSRKIALISKN